MYFDELDLNDNVLDALYDMNFETCTPVQESCIPEILKGKDVLGVAQTGTGKTAAYLLPILSMLDDGNYQEDAINCIIMAPTRELAQQIDQAMQGFGYYLNGISSVAIYGGNDGTRYDQELKSLSLGADVVIATPGRFLSHISLDHADLSKVSFFVLDEADRMLDMGFYDDIMTIAKKLPENCQTILFSATMPDNIEKLAKNLLKDPVKIKLAVSKPAEKIQQSAYVCHDTQKLDIIRDIFKAGNLKRVIIFSGKKQTVKQINLALQRMKINSGEMHSDLAQAQRDEMMYQFKSGQIDVLVATDILSRGIDIDDIAMVINYDVPHDAEDYVHRIGRTARADRDGVAITFVSPYDITYFKQIEKFLGKEIHKNTLPDGMDEGPDYSSGGKKHTNAKNRRKKNRDNNAHRRKPHHKDEREEKKSTKALESDNSKTDHSVSNSKKEQAKAASPNKSKQQRRKEQLPPSSNEEKSNKPNSNSTGKGRKKVNDPAKQKGETPNKPVMAEVSTPSSAEKTAPTKKKRRKKKPQRTTIEQPATTKYNVTEVLATSKKKENSLKEFVKKPLNWLKSFGKRK